MPREKEKVIECTEEGNANVSIPSIVNQEEDLAKIAVWPNYDWCFGDEIESFLMSKSDDYIIVGMPADMDEPTDEFLREAVDGKSVIQEQSTPKP